MQKGNNVPSKSYKATDSQTNMMTRKLNTKGISNDKAKEFITQSRILDNELNHMVAMMKLNNKDEFYGGALFTKNEKDHITNNATDEELVELLDQLLIDLDNANTQEEFNDINENITFLTYMVNEVEDVLKTEGKYNELHGLDKKLMEEVLRRNNDANPGTKAVLKELGYDLERNRSNGNGKIGELNAMNSENLINTYTGQNSQYKSKRGIRVIGDIDASKLTPEFLIVIKKITNIITGTLLPLAQTLYDLHFQGINEQDKLSIPELYHDMDEKMYILTSLNNQTNSQLIKLDKDFDRLYSLVSNGLKSYVPATGGSMFKTQHMYYK